MHIFPSVFEEPGLIYQGSYCYQNVKHLNMWIVKWTAAVTNIAQITPSLPKSGAHFAHRPLFCISSHQCIPAPARISRNRRLTFHYISFLYQEIVSVRVSGKLNRVAYLKPIFKCPFFPQIHCFLISLFFHCISMSCIVPERFLSASLSLAYLSLSTQWIRVNWWIQMSPNVPSTRQKSGKEGEREGDGIKRKESRFSFFLPTLAAFNPLWLIRHQKLLD